MDSALLSLLAAFLLSIIGLLAFIWSLRKGLLIENPRAAATIFAHGEIGKADDPALGERDAERFQQAVTAAHDAQPHIEAMAFRSAMQHLLDAVVLRLWQSDRRHREHFVHTRERLQNLENP